MIPHKKRCNSCSKFDCQVVGDSLFRTESLKSVRDAKFRALLRPTLVVLDYELCDKVGAHSTENMFYKEVWTWFYIKVGVKHL
jgi:hypothetical protein